MTKTTYQTKQINYQPGGGQAVRLAAPAGGHANLGIFLGKAPDADMPVAPALESVGVQQKRILNKSRNYLESHHLHK
jgi:hypothetical protein